MPHPLDQKGKSSNIFRNKDDDVTTYDLKNLNVLLVEDSRSMQTLIASMLRSFGVGDVLVCEGGNEAIGILTITQARKKGSDIKGIDIVLTDWLMPQGSGVELLEWIRSHEADNIKFLPVLLLSAYTTQKVIATARDNGANEALVKPVSGATLAGRILSIIDKPRAFVKTENFFGPDRRRQDMAFKGPDRRKIQAEMIKVNHEQL
ncbi:MAG: response regulator [Alphaproteobacteria bacterium]|nr:response regulator [Alphaproteobacteria bacterium]MCD8520120.1 response regulator [Alphaproteobacteria bacterium]MCD8525939.1 response regulator [Alphaproteobacteria bacterium]MCD8571091.1 response regulator [Alphaproteobacteria bacterium]